MTFGDIISYQWDIRVYHSMQPDQYWPKLDCIASALDILMHKIAMVTNPAPSPKTTVDTKPSSYHCQTQFFHIPPGYQTWRAGKWAIYR